MHILIAAIYIHCTSITSYVPHNISETNTDCILLGQDVTNGIGGHIRTNIIHFTYISFAHRELTIIDVLHDSITLEQPWVRTLSQLSCGGNSYPWDEFLIWLARRDGVKGSRLPRRGEVTMKIS